MLLAAATSRDYRRANVLRSERSMRARARAKRHVQVCVRLGCDGHLVGVVRTAELARDVLIALERASPAEEQELFDLLDHVESFGRFARRERAWIRQQIAEATKAAAPTPNRC